MKWNKIKGLFLTVAFITALTNTACSFEFTHTTPIKDEAAEIIHIVSDDIDAKMADLQNSYEQTAELYNMVVDAAEKLEASSAEIEGFQRATLVRVVDGDTIVVNVEGDEVKVRMIGIDTPESVASAEYLEKTGKENTKEGFTASEYTKELLSDVQYVWLQKDTSDVDKYDRALRYVWLETPDYIDTEQIATYMVNGILLADKIAKPVQYAPDTKYAEEFEDIYMNY